MNFSQSFPIHQSISNNNWEQLYNQLLFSYYQLSEYYRNAVNQNLKLTQQLKQKQQIFNQAQKLFTQNLNKLDTKKTLQEESHHQDETNKQVEKKFKLRSIKKSRNQRKGKALINNQYLCTYPDCNRCYDSSVSLNLHIKLKHNGGTKKQRQTYAKMILDAQEKGLQPPKIGINFPPNFLEDFRISYKYMKKYSM